MATILEMRDITKTFPGVKALDRVNLQVAEGEIHALYLLPEARGQGIGQALIAHAQARSPRLGLWAHAANHPARRFYAAAGFRPVSVGASNDERLTEIRFEWEGAA